MQWLRAVRYTANPNTRNRIPRTICTENAVSCIECTAVGDAKTICACGTEVGYGATRSHLLLWYGGRRVLQRPYRSKAAIG
eukprot:3643503-Rhodomonas_salina.1